MTAMIEYIIVERAVQCYFSSELEKYLIFVLILSRWSAYVDADLISLVS